VHTGPKANTNKNTNKQIYVVPQNRIRPRRQQIVYYWRNATNTQLNLVQSHKTQCFTLTLGVSLKSALFHSHSCTIFFCTLALSLHSLYTTFCTLSSLSSFIQERRILAATHVQPNKCQSSTTRLLWLKGEGG
jgi:hypothetical protein